MEEGLGEGNMFIEWEGLSEDGLSEDGLSEDGRRIGRREHVY